MGHCSFSTRGSFVFSAGMVILGVGRETGEQLVKHTKGLRLFLEKFYLLYLCKIPSIPSCEGVFDSGKLML